MERAWDTALRLRTITGMSRNQQGMKEGKEITIKNAASYSQNFYQQIKLLCARISNVT